MPAPTQFPRSQLELSRRSFLAAAAAATGGLALGCAERTVGPLSASLEAERLIAPEASGIEHIVLVMMENRSFDHFLGWLPGARGRQAGLAYTDAAGVAHATYPLAPDFQGCGHKDPNHGYDGGRVEYDGGECDGWLRVNDIYSIGYYQRADLPFFGQAAPQWMTFDHYFCAILGPTFPNRIYQHAGQTDRLSNTLNVVTLPTIWDRLAARGVEGRYYFGDLPVVGLWGSRYLSIVRPLTAFFADCAAGTLPPVSFVDPPFLGEETGTGRDDHPFTDIRAGEAFMNKIYTAVTTSPAWKGTVLFINFDEWGGFFDHVPPSPGPISAITRAAGDTDGLRGFRTPALLVSPFARRAETSHHLYDHTSVLRMIEWRWGLEPLAIRDRHARNIAHDLDLSGPNLSAPTYTVPAVTPAACPAIPVAPTARTSAGVSSARAHWLALRDLAARHGFDVPPRE